MCAAANLFQLDELTWAPLGRSRAGTLRLAPLAGPLCAPKTAITYTALGTAIEFSQRAV
jgi:hypothetical protein